MKHYRITIAPLVVEAEGLEDATQQALSMIEEGAWDLRIEDHPGPVIPGHICQEVKVSLAEILDAHMNWEDFSDMLKTRVEENIGRELVFWQMTCYSIVDHSPEGVTIEVEGYEEDA